MYNCLWRSSFTLCAGSLSGNPITSCFAFVWRGDVEIASSSQFIDHSSGSNRCAQCARPDGLERGRENIFFTSHPAPRCVFFPGWESRARRIGLAVYSSTVRHRAPLSNNRDRPSTRNGGGRYTLGGKQ